MTATKKAGWVKERSNGQYELVKSVRKGKKTTHEVIMQLGEHATVKAAYDFMLAESKAGLRKGEGHTNAKVRRLKAGDAALVLERYLPKPARVAIPEVIVTHEDVAKAGQAEREKARLDYREKWAGSLQRQFHLLRQKPTIDAEAQRRQREDMEYEVKTMFALLTTLEECPTFHDQLDAIYKAGRIAFQLAKQAASMSDAMPRRSLKTPSHLRFTGR